MMHTPFDSKQRTEVVDLQLAVFEVAKTARGEPVHEVRRKLAEAIIGMRVTPPSGLWLDAAATSASLGYPYIISNEARWGAEAILRKQPLTPRPDST